MGDRLVGRVVAIETMEAWLNATPESRHEGRIEKLRELDYELAREEK
jgi:ribose 5-phosphate isomerase RpiB